MRAKFDVLQQTHGIRLQAKLRLDRFIMSPSGGEKSKILPFWTSAFLFVVSLIGSNLRRLSTGRELETFRYPTVSKSFL